MTFLQSGRQRKVRQRLVGQRAGYVNGVEVGRSHLPEGKIEAHTPATDYPVDAYTVEDGGAPLPGVSPG